MARIEYLSVYLNYIHNAKGHAMSWFAGKVSHVLFKEQKYAEKFKNLLTQKLIL